MAATSVGAALMLRARELIAASRECTPADDAAAGSATSAAGTTCTLEIEMRLGTRHGARFVSGVARPVYDAIGAAMHRADDPLRAAVPGAAALRVRETLDVYDEVRRVRYTFAVDPADGTVWCSNDDGNNNNNYAADVAIVHKNHVIAADCAEQPPHGPALQLRLAAALEQAAVKARVPALVARAAGADYTLRRKSRSSLALADGALTLELTRVATSKHSGGAVSTQRGQRAETALSAVLAAWNAGAAATAPSTVTYECELEYVMARDGATQPLRGREINGIAYYFNAVAQRLAAIVADAAPVPAPVPAPQPGGAGPDQRGADERLLASAPWLAACGGTEAEAVLRRVRELSAQAVPRELSASVLRARAFTGAMPVALRRAHLATLDTRLYMVSEKSDGVRMQLYACGTTAFMVDRRNSVRRVCGSDTAATLAALLGGLGGGAGWDQRGGAGWDQRGGAGWDQRGGELLLDGELVESLRADAPRHVYLAFDLLGDTTRASAHAPALAQLFFYERLQRIASAVVAPLRALAAAGAAPPLPFELCGKPFWPLAKLDELLARVRSAGPAQPGGAGQHQMRYADARRCHASDGLMLVPNERGVRPFTCDAGGGALATFKLKFCHSIDLVVRHAPLRLCCGAATGSGGAGPTQRDGAELVVATADALAPPDAFAQLAAGAIVECVYAGGVWRLVGVRAKSAPNHVAVVLDTLLAHLDAVSIVDLQARIAIFA